MERKEEVGLVGCGGKKMGRLRCAGLHRSKTAERQRETWGGRHGCATRDCTFYHAAGWARWAFRAGGSCRRATTDTLRTGRVAGHQFALQTADEPGIQTLEG